MTYSESLAALSRTPVTLVVITLDSCSRIFGTSPCLAGGTQCYNTFATCAYKSAWDKTTVDYKFVSANAPLPFKTGERPYISAVDYLPTEIKTTLTVTGRFKVTFADEPDTDVGIDPYWAERSSVQGTFWKKLLARNPNYKGRPIKIYEGFLGLAEADFVLKTSGVIENISLSRSGVVVEGVDLLKSLADVYVPPKLDIKVVADITDGDAAVTVTDVTGLDSPSGYVLMGKEIVSYTGCDTGTGVLSGLTRGAFGTTAESHSANTKVQKVRYFPEADGFDILQELLTVDGGVDAACIDQTAFDYWDDWPPEDILFSAIIPEPISVDKLYFELLELLDCKSWVNEDSKITIRRNMPNAPDRSYGEITDAEHIIAGSINVDLNESSRVTRVALYTDKTTLGKISDPQEFNRLDVAIDADAESANEYNDVKEKTIYSRWLSSAVAIPEESYNRYINNLASRILLRHRDAQRALTLSVELKDSGLKTGDYCLLSTEALEAIDGNPLERYPCEIYRRDVVDNRIELRVLLLPPEKIGFIAPDATPAYDSASDAEKEYGFITDDTGLINGQKGYYIW